MSDKPKKWTFKEWRDENPIKEGLLLVGLSNPFADCFYANEPLIDWQEKEIERLRSINYQQHLLLTTEESDLGQTIAKLREALDYYAGFIAGINGDIARTALKECFGGEYES